MNELTASMLNGRVAVRQAWQDLLCGLDGQTRRLELVDVDFVEWPLSDPAVLQALATWLPSPGRSLRMLGLDFDATQRAHPRFARWRRDWQHRIQTLAPADPAVAAQSGRWPRLMVSDLCAIEWIDPDHWRARRHGHVGPCLLQVDAIAQQCESAWPIRPLGL